MGQPSKLLRLYVNEQDRYAGKPLYEAIVDRCRELRLSGATVFRALEGFGETAELHHAHVLRSDLPIVITIIERSEKIAAALPLLEEMMHSGLVALTDVEVTYILNGQRIPPP